MGKVFWFDVETTGVNSRTNAIIQLSALVEIDGNIVEEINYTVKPFAGAVIDKRALEVNGITQEALTDFTPHNLAYANLVTLLSKYVKKFDPFDKFILAGYNVGFDEGFLRAFFDLNNDRYFGSYFVWPKIDVAHLVAEEYKNGLRLSNFKLGTVCNYYGISLDAHDAMNDIRATRSIYYTLMEKTPLP